MLVKFWIWS